MRVFCFYLGSLCFFLPFVGCADPALPQADHSAKERLTLQDLQPADVHLLQPQIFLNWVEFEIGVEAVPDIAKTLNPFSSEPIQFQNASLYRQNGISVLFGKTGQGAALTEAMARLKAKSLKRTMLMTLNETPEFYSTAITMGDSLIYYTTPANQTTQRSYPPGQFGFMLTASLTAKRDSIDVECRPAFVPAVGLPYYHDKAANDYGATYLPPGQFKATLAEGDFLILAPNRDSTQTTPDNALFRLTGKKAKTRIYVILFARVDN
jgi:hypothetical protein